MKGGRQYIMAIATNLGFPRIGTKRELKRAVESFWAGEIGPEELESTAKRLRREHWKLQQDIGIEHIPSNDFSLYDQVLDTAAMLGAVPARFGYQGEAVDLATYFAMARGSDEVPAMEMTKWFDSNYHFIVPEFETGQRFRLASTKPVDEFKEALALGIQTRPVLLGPVSFLLLGKSREDELDPLSLLDGLLPVYEDVLYKIMESGADWVQIDEPALALDLPQHALAAFDMAYGRLNGVTNKVKICLATYFGDLRRNLMPALRLPVAALHLDLVRAPQQVDWAVRQVSENSMLSLGVIDGRNVWRTNLGRILELIEKAVVKLGPDRILIGPSCSLLHCPIDLELEDTLDEELKGWMAFARQKLGEIVILMRAVNDGRGAVAEAIAESRALAERRRQSSRIHNPQVKDRVANVDEKMLERKSPFRVRRQIQRAGLNLPLLPTTTIGSFPQTAEVRKARAAFRKGDWPAEKYEAFLKQEIEKAVRFQEEIGLDVLVHGEFERNDMVEYFGEQLEGIAFTQDGWVQSYGTRCIKPPVIYGDVRRDKPMTVPWIKYAQSLTTRPLKGMLTGPITILQWSFVRDDQPRRETACQIALAIRDEVADLEAAGIRIIQIDEPALREGLPLSRDEWPGYLKWTVDVFRLASSGVRDDTQIHTHMCYSEFNDIIEAIAALDADVISIEASRSDMELLDAFVRFQYPYEIGPGIYDIHSPRVPSVDEIVALLRKALNVFRAEWLWVNPDCGLKTRGWPEVHAALQNMVVAAKALRGKEF
jgi:5-methyltetrahydropteroyltriglutamate--homocysteine methyltransferase